MFIFKFTNIRDKQLITRIKIEGPVITIYVAKEDMKRFAQKYAKVILAARYKFLTIGQGVFHNIAHGSDKSLRFLFGERKTEHFHILCPAYASIENLKELLSLFSDEALNESKKNEIMEAYTRYRTQANLNRVIETLKSQTALTFLIAYQDHVLAERAPLVAALTTEIAKFSDKQSEDNDAQRKPFVMPDVTVTNGDYLVNLKKYHAGLADVMKSLIEISNLIPLLTDYQKQKIVKEDLIKSLQVFFSKYATMNVVNYVDILPHAHEEFRNNLAYLTIQETLKSVAKDLSVLLDTAFEYTPGEISDAERANYSAVVGVAKQAMPEKELQLRGKSGMSGCRIL